ncbi:MAG TPA: preprotein translocase subunit YajC [Gemmatimonadaceae bacterium]|jgi:preprotein translocase subunit YajC|nr:preprotein translocase subunit YajC [Gemmatimonadaceae bacterium]
MISPTSGLPFSLILAQAGGGATGGSSLMPLLVQFALIIGIIYFLMVRPQQKQRRQHEESLRALKRGDEIVTTGGIIGEVIHIREMNKEAGNKLDDRVTIKSGESRIVVERGRIAKILGAASTTSQGGSTSS